MEGENLPILPQLNLPGYSFRIKTQGQRKYIFDKIRKRYVVLTPEEWVRQNMVMYLVGEKKFPSSLMAVEMHLTINGMAKRADIILFSKQGKPLIIVECKSPSVKISQAVFDQAALYNMDMKVQYLLVTNGMVHYCARLDHTAGTWSFLPDIPDYVSSGLSGAFGTEPA
jgi:hypothetical protein